MRVVHIEPGSDADLDAVGEAGQLFGRLLRRDIADHHVGGYHLLDALRRLDDAHVVRMGAVDADGIHACLIQRNGPLDVERSHGRRDAQLVAAVADGLRVLPPLEDVLHHDDADEVAFLVDHRQPLDLVLVHDVDGFLDLDVLPGGDQAARHDVADLLARLQLDDGPHVPAADDADELAVLDDGDARDALLRHHAPRGLDSLAGAGREHFPEDDLLAPLDFLDLLDLLVAGHVPVDDADAALVGHGDGHLRFRDRIHGGADDRDVETDIL